MAGAIQLEKTKEVIASGEIAEDRHRAARLFVEFLNYAGVSIDEITNVATYETFNAKLQAASNNITDQILEYWTQNPDLSVNVRIEQSRPGDLEPLNAGTIHGPASTTASIVSIPHSQSAVRALFGSSPSSSNLLR